MKIKWALCKKEDLIRFKADLNAHTESIEILLITVQMAATRIDSKKNDQQYRTLAGKVQELYFRYMQRINLVLERVSTGIQQGKQLLDATAKIIQTNIKIFQIVLNIQNVITRIPGQVDRQQPVYFEDAHGRIAPFHIEFINSFDAFQAVMEVRFRHVPGLKKVQNIEYAIHESSSKRKLDLTAPWDSIFLPGRKVNMSMVFRRPQTSMSSCPGCQTENEIDSSNKGSEIQCSNVDCKMYYQRIVEMDAPKIQLGKRSRKATPASSRKRSKQPVVEGADHGAEEAADDDDEDEDEDEIHQFRRVSVLHKNPDRRSVPEQTDFIALLRHFGTDWHGIAKWITSKTHIYATVFRQWLAIPPDSNKSRRVANIQTQVKNYYQRQVDSGKIKEWEDIARDVDDKKSRGEEIGPLPQPTIIPKRRYNMPPGSVQRSGSAMEGVEDMASTGQNSLTHTSPPQIVQQRSRPPRAAAMGYFTPPRPIIQAGAVSQRSLLVAQEAHVEGQLALRLEREQREYST